jgi:hypothetical protein
VDEGEEELSEAKVREAMGGSFDSFTSGDKK